MPRGFETAGTSVALVWYGDFIPSDDPDQDDADVAVKGITFQDPVYLATITGKVFELDKSA